VLADDPAPCARGVPGVEDLLHFPPQAVELGQLLFQQRAHVDAWTRLRTPERHDMADLLQREAEPARLRDEVQHTEHVGRIHAIPGGGASRLRHDAACFVEAQRLAGHPATGGHLSDPERVVGHEARIDLAA